MIHLQRSMPQALPALVTAFALACGPNARAAEAPSAAAPAAPAAARSASLRMLQAECTPWRTPRNATVCGPPGSPTAMLDTERFTAWSAVELWHM